MKKIVDNFIWQATSTIQFLITSSVKKTTSFAKFFYSKQERMSHISLNNPNSEISFQ
jgi:hypothetical protein